MIYVLSLVRDRVHSFIYTYQLLLDHIVLIIWLAP